MIFARTTGAIWLCIGLSSIVYGVWHLELGEHFGVLVTDVFIGLFFVLAAFSGYSLLRGKLWAFWPLRIQAILFLLVGVLHLWLRDMDLNLSVWLFLLFSVWTLIVPAFVKSHDWA